MYDNSNSKEARQRFCDILTATGRQNIDYVLEDLESWGFFDSPASSQGHGAYKLVKKKKRNEIGTYEDVETYEIHDENFPVGHGEKSVILLLQSGLDLTDDEIYAIRWHMGPWNLSRDDERFYRQAGRISALQPLIHCADTIASALLERPGAQL